MRSLTMRYRNCHAHNWLVAPSDGALLNVCSICGAQRSVTTFLLPQVANNFATQEIALWMEYLLATIALQQNAITQMREKLPTAKTPFIGQTLTHLERSLAVNKCTLLQFEVVAQMVLGQPRTVPSTQLPLHRPSSDINC